MTDRNTKCVKVFAAFEDQAQVPRQLFYTPSLGSVIVCTKALLIHWRENEIMNILDGVLNSAGAFKKS